MKTKTNSNHSRFNPAHYNNCATCYEEHLDLMDEQELDERATADENSNNEEEL